MMRGTALVTGSAGGIGTALCEALLARGHDLILTGSNPEKLAAQAAALGGKTRMIVADLTLAEDCERLCAVIAAEPRLTLLVNNAGIVEPGAVIDLPAAVLNRHIAINLVAPMLLTQAAARVMVPQGHGTILSILSIASLVSLPGGAAYNASKFGLRGFLIAASQELAPHGIKVCSVLPGAVDTPMLRHEATHGGSPLNFLNKDVLSPAQVVAAAMRAIDRGKLETMLPTGDAITARILGAFPALQRYVLPSLMKSGERGLERFLAARGLKRAAITPT